MNTERMLTEINDILSVPEKKSAWIKSFRSCMANGSFK